MQSLPDELAQQLRETLGVNQAPSLVGPVAGGDVSSSYRARLDRFDLFIKLNDAATAPMFAAEFMGLQTLGRRQALRVPEPVCHGADETSAWLVLEFIDLQRDGDHEALGRGLADMHRVTGPEYGWPMDNFIGVTPQPNGPLPDWSEFWWQRRLGYLVDRLTAQGDPGGLAQRAEAVHERLPALFAGRVPRASLLHGDLWCGNVAFDTRGRPVLFDPACYHGDRETDIAMAELFGGFDPRCLAAYREAWPMAVGYAWRRPLYQAYHLLNHLLMFGAGWLPRVNRCLDEVIEATP